MKNTSRTGATLIEVVLGVGLVFMLFGGLFLFYQTVVDVLSNTDLRAVGNSILNREMETIKNLPFDQVGTQGGIPSGVLQAVKIATTTTSWVFSVKTTVRNIDDPFDGLLGGTPNDTAPTDYKLVELEATCTTCPDFIPLILTARVAPKNLESGTNSGSIFVNVFDGYGGSVAGATVHVINTSTIPSIDLTDTTNQSGVLQLVGVPTSTQGYQISATKAGYSTDRTYPSGDPANPNPKKANVNVAAQTLTPLSLEIDPLSTLTVQTQNTFCQGIGNQAFSFSGAKLIGENPDVIKFSTSSQTGANGSKTYDATERDTYTFTYAGSYDLAGTIPFSPYIVAAGSSSTFAFVLQSANPRSFLITVKDGATQAPVSGAMAHLWKAGYSATQTAGHSTYLQTGWSAGAYTDKSGIDTDTVPGSLLMTSQGGKYSTTTTAWLISQTMDFGTASTTFYALEWLPTTQPGGAGSDSVRFQIAANNDNATWNFSGPGGDSGAYYTSSSAPIDASWNGKRYMRYKVFFTTEDETVTPGITEVSMDYSSPCVPGSQILFSGLGSGSYSLDVSAAGYSNSTSTVSISGSWQQSDVLMNP